MDPYQKRLQRNNTYQARLARGELKPKEGTKNWYIVKIMNRDSEKYYRLAKLDRDQLKLIWEGENKLLDFEVRKPTYKQLEQELEGMGKLNEELAIQKEALVEDKKLLNEKLEQELKINETLNSKIRELEEEKERLRRDMQELKSKGLFSNNIFSKRTVQKGQI